MVSPLVILDIGSTLVIGPHPGPARRIAETIGATEHTANKIHHILMTSDCAGPDEAADALVEIADADTGALRSAVHDVWNMQRSDAQPLPGALRALAQLAHDGAQLALLSDIWPPYLESVRIAYGELFDRSIPRQLQLFSFREGERKPSTALVARLLDRGGRTPARAVMVGDSYRKDIEPAAALDLATVLVRPEGVRDGEVPLATETLKAVANLDVDLIRSILHRHHDGRHDALS